MTTYYNTLITKTAEWISPWINDTVVGEQFHAEEDFNQILQRHVYDDDHAYLSNLKRVIESNNPPIVYTWNTETRSTRIARHIWSVIVFPIFLHKVVLWIFAKFLSLLAFCSAENKKELTDIKIHPTQTEWRYQRIAFQVDDTIIDAWIMGTKDTFCNDKWMLLPSSLMNYEQLVCPSIQKFVTELRVNCLLLNPPGQGANPGACIKENTIKTYRAALQFLEHAQGIHAETILYYGYCIEGAIQNTVLRSHHLKDKICYIFIKNQSFTKVSDCALHYPYFNSWYSKWIGHIAQWIIQASDLDLGDLDSSIHLQHPEIIIQASTNRDTELKTSDDVADDAVVSRHASLANALLPLSLENKHFIPRDFSHKQFKMHNNKRSYYDISFPVHRIISNWK